MRIIHDSDRCASTGMCEATAPDLFEVGADGELRVLQPQPAENARARAAAAVAACPTGALRLQG